MLNDKVYVIDLKANPPKLAGTVTVGKQPSGLSISPAGDIALVANRADKSISVLSIKGTDVKVIDTIAMGDRSRRSCSRPTAGAPWRPNSPPTKWRCSRSTATRSPTASSTCRLGCGHTMCVVAPDGKIAFTADNGGCRRRSDGNVDTVSVVDLEAKPPRVSIAWWSATARKGLRSVPRATSRSP